MKLVATRLEGPLLLEPAVHGDDRGFFQETYRKSALAELGVHDEFVQDNHSRSRHGIVRGIHFQVGEGAAKLVRCGRGEILDVLVDLRRGSPTYGQWEAFELSDRNHRVLYAPIGFGHGFCVTGEVADVFYKQSSYYRAEVDRGIRFDDPDVGIAWPAGIELSCSERDASAPLLREVADSLPFVYEPRAAALKPARAM